MSELYINLKVIARARVNKIGNEFIDSSGKSVLKIYVTSPAKQDKANEAVIELLANKFQVAKRDIEIMQGRHNNNKLILIKNYTAI